MKNKGFTLVELLAVVVILMALVALITPKIFSQLKTAGDVTEKEQINSLINISKIYMNQHPNLLPEEDGINTITLTELKQSGLIKSEEILNPNTQEELTGCIVVTSKNNKYEYKYSEDNMTCNLKVSMISNRIKYYDTEWIKNNPVYFNPESGICTKTDYENNEENLGKTGCMKWYAYSENLDETINMILDHNTTSNIDWVNIEDYSIQEGNTVGITYPQGYELGVYQTGGNHSSGPITALKQLKSDTDSWMDSLKRNDTYNQSIINKNNQNIEYTINYQNYKARLITAEEVATMTYAFDEQKYGGLGFTMNNTTQIYFYLDGKQGTVQNWKTKIHNTKGASKYSWLFDNNGKDATHLCESYGCTYNPIESMYTYGYWTSSANASQVTDAWTIDYDGTLYNNAVAKVNRGIRPVITVNKNIFFN